jgi:hypothetical protein
MFSVYSGIYYISAKDPSEEGVRDDDLKANSTVKAFLYLLIIACNAYFICYWSFHMVKECKEAI